MKKPVDDATEDKRVNNKGRPRKLTEWDERKILREVGDWEYNMDISQSNASKMQLM